MVCLWGKQLDNGVGVFFWFCCCGLVFFVVGLFFFSVFLNFKLGNILNKYYLIKNEFWSSVLVKFPRKPKQMFLSLHCHSFANLIQTWKRRRYWTHWVLEYFINVCSWEEGRELMIAPLRERFKVSSTWDQNWSKQCLQLMNPVMMLFELLLMCILKTRGFYWWVFFGVGIFFVLFLSSELDILFLPIFCGI